MRHEITVREHIVSAISAVVIVSVVCAVVWFFNPDLFSPIKARYPFPACEIVVFDSNARTEGRAVYVCRSGMERDV